MINTINGPNVINKDIADLAVALPDFSIFCAMFAMKRIVPTNKKPYPMMVPNTLFLPLPPRVMNKIIHPANIVARRAILNNRYDCEPGTILSLLSGMMSVTNVYNVCT